MSATLKIYRHGGVIFKKPEFEHCEPWIARVLLSYQQQI